MDRTALSRRIREILDENKRIENELFALHMTDPEKYPENYEVLSLDIALRSESLTCRLRNLVYDTTDFKKPEYLINAANIHNITIENKDGVIEIVLPALIHKKRRQQGKFLTDPLYAAFSAYTADNQVEPMKSCIVYISLVFSANRKRLRDYDNVESKHLIDAISTYFLVDDSGKYVDVHYATEIGKHDLTKVYLIEKEAFPAWLKDHLNTVKTISHF